MSSNICRWGILSTAEIGKKNWQAIRNAGNAKLVAVASRGIEKAESFIDACQSVVPHPERPVALGSYEELLARKDIDAVYIPLPTGLRKEWVIKAANAGKHVLCEKPCAISYADLKEMTGACEANRVQFMDGVMYMHSSRLEALRKTIDSAEQIGTIRRIATQFSFNGEGEFVKKNIRVSSDLEPQGCLGDLGWYTIRFILWAMKYEMPVRLAARMIHEFGREDCPGKVPMEISFEMFFANGVTASSYCSFRTENQQWINVSGTRGYVHMRDFVLPFFGSELSYDVTQAAFEVDGCDFNMKDRTTRTSVSEYANSFANSQEANLLRNFSKLAIGGKPDSHWPTISLKTQLLMDLCLHSARNGGEMVVITAC